MGSLLWEAAKFGFQVYVATAVPYSAIYGSIGLIPLFLFWIYVTWLIVLFGLILTYTLQVLGGRALGRIDGGIHKVRAEPIPSPVQAQFGVGQDPHPFDVVVKLFPCQGAHNR